MVEEFRRRAKTLQDFQDKGILKLKRKKVMHSQSTQGGELFFLLKKVERFIKDEPEKFRKTILKLDDPKYKKHRWRISAHLKKYDRILNDLKGFRKKLEQGLKPTRKQLSEAELLRHLSPKQLKELRQKQKFKKVVVAVEGNLLEIPIADYSRGLVKKNRNYVVYKKGNIKMEIGSMYGALTGFDEKIFKGGLCNFTQRIDDKYIANFSLYGLAESLGLPISGRLTERLRLSLKRIGSLNITHASFYLSSKKGHQAIVGYPLFQFFSTPNKDDKRRENYFIWNDLIAKNLLAKYFKYLDRKVYLALPSPISRRLYDYLEKKFGKGDHYQQGEKSFIEKIPIKSKNYSYARGILIKNLGRLRDIWKEEKGVILKYEIKNGVIFFTRSRRKTREEYKEEEERVRAEREERDPGQQRRNTAFIGLTNLGVNSGMIVSLFKKYDLEIIENQLRWLPYRKVTKNKAGFIVKAIKENWTMPGRYEAEREEKLKERRLGEGRKTRPKLARQALGNLRKGLK